MKKGFTLIELMVVVLIIAILSAISIPQYTKSVERSRASEAFLLLKAMKSGQDIYRMERRDKTLVARLDEIMVTIPGSDITYAGQPAKLTKMFRYSILSNGNPHAWRTDDGGTTVKYTLGYNQSSGSFFCHSASNKYSDVCRSLGGKLTSGDCSNGDGRECFYI